MCPDELADWIRSLFYHALLPKAKIKMHFLAVYQLPKSASKEPAPISCPPLSRSFSSGSTWMIYILYKELTFPGVTLSHE